MTSEITSRLQIYQRKTMMAIFGVIRRKSKPVRKPAERISDLFIRTNDFVLVNGEAIFLDKGRKQR